MCRGDESVPSEAALTFFFKWAYEYNHREDKIDYPNGANFKPVTII